MCQSMVNIQSPTAEIRRGKKRKIDRKKKETTGQKYNGPLLHRAAITISPVVSLDYSQSTRVTDGRTDGQTDGQNYDSQDLASIAESRGKNALKFAGVPQTRQPYRSQPLVGRTSKFTIL